MRKISISEAKNNPELINDFMTQNQMLVHHALKKFNLDDNYYDDAFQAGMVALHQCILNYDESYNDKFTNYCVMCIRGNVGKLFRDGYFSTIKPPRWYKQYKILVYRDKSIEEIAEQIKVPVPQIKEIVTTLNNCSLDMEFGERENMPVYEAVDSGVELEHDGLLYASLRQFVHDLNKKDKEIFVLRYKGYTQQEIRDILGVTQAHVSRTLRRLLPVFKSYIFG